MLLSSLLFIPPILPQSFCLLYFIITFINEFKYISEVVFLKAIQKQGQAQMNTKMLRATFLSLSIASNNWFIRNFKSFPRLHRVVYLPVKKDRG